MAGRMALEMYIDYMAVQQMNEYGTDLKFLERIFRCFIDNLNVVAL
jgi:hypothetical protein